MKMGAINSGDLQITAGFSPFFNASPRELPGAGDFAPHHWDFSAQPVLSLRLSVEPQNEPEETPEPIQERAIPVWQAQIAGLEKRAKDSSAQGKQSEALDYVRQIDRTMKKIIALSTAGSLAAIIAKRRNRVAWQGIRGMNRTLLENQETERKAA